MIDNNKKGKYIKIYRQKLDVYKGEAHEVIANGITSTEYYSYVFFQELDNTYRHFKTFDTYDEAYAFMLKMFLKSDIYGLIRINKEHWHFTENEIQLN